MRSFTELVGRSSSICLQDKFPKNVVNSRNNIWWQIIEIFYSNSNFYPPPLYCKQVDLHCFHARAARLFKSKNYMHVELVYKPFFANKYKSFLSQPSFFCIQFEIFTVIPQKRVFFAIFSPTCDAKNGLKFFWIKMMKIGSITFSITYFSWFLAVYYGMQCYILEQVKSYRFEHPKKTLSHCPQFLT